MGAWLTRRLQRVAARDIKVLVLGLTGAGKTRFLDAFDLTAELGWERRPTCGTHVVNVDVHRNCTLHLMEVGGTVPNAYADNLLPSHDALYYIVDATAPLHEVYASKQRLFGLMLKLPADVPVCIVFNVPPPPQKSLYDGCPKTVRQRRQYRQLTRQQLLRIFQLRGLRARGVRSISTLYLTYEEVRPVERMFQWTESTATSRPTGGD